MNIAYEVRKSDKVLVIFEGERKMAQCRFEWKLTSATMSATAVNA